MISQLKFPRRSDKVARILWPAGVVNWPLVRTGHLLSILGAMRGAGRPKSEIRRENNGPGAEPDWGWNLDPEMRVYIGVFVPNATKSALFRQSGPAQKEKNGRSLVGIKLLSRAAGGRATWRGHK
ncbi:hypothetical protein Zmor_019638 [Zophobas morio]|uniref:Uncharacterized protein n=1 Tax=Zophobas morio TaxID=2755281 RepID=A0AA38I243_9CUCU|nr:hypothetical protein Zmor_019638 [Zophobas morio]